MRRQKARYIIWKLSQVLDFRPCNTDLTLLVTETARIYCFGTTYCETLAPARRMMLKFAECELTHTFTGAELGKTGQHHLCRPLPQKANDKNNFIYPASHSLSYKIVEAVAKSLLALATGFLVLRVDRPFVTGFFGAATGATQVDPASISSTSSSSQSNPP